MFQISQIHFHDYIKKLLNIFNMILLIIYIEIYIQIFLKNLKMI